MREGRRLGVLFLLGLSLAWLASCARPSPREELLEAVRAYWGAVSRGEWAEAYVYEYPLLKKTVPKEVYVSRHGNPLVRITGYELEGVEFPGKDRALVSLKVQLRLFLPGLPKGGGVLKIPVRDHWRRINGRWYHVPKKQKKRGRA